MKSNKGFTLIELLVVIAIIGILSSVVLASLTTARTKGKNAAVQSELSSMRAQAELYYSTNANQYANVNNATYAASTSNTQVFNPFTSTNNSLGNLTAAVISGGATNASGYASTTGWSFSVTLPDGATTYCVDSAGDSLSGKTATNAPTLCS